MNLNKRDKKEILEYLKHITSELTVAYNSTPDTAENSDAIYFIDTARDLVDELTINVEDNQEVPVPHEDLRKEKEFDNDDDLVLSMMVRGEGIKC